MIKKTMLALLFAILAAAPSDAQAQTLARTYFLTPQPNTGRTVEAALLDFTSWLRQEGDPWSWSFFQVVAGDNLGSWVMRSSGHDWADFDARDAGFGPRAVERFQATVMPLLQSVTLQLEQLDGNLSRQAPSGGETNNLFHITDWRLTANGQGAFNQSVGSMIESYDEAGVSYYASYHNILSGADGPLKRRARSYPDWESFADAPNLPETMVGAYGEDGMADIMNTYGGAVESVSNFVIRIRRDMSVPGM